MTAYRAAVHRRAPLYALYVADVISLAGNAVAQLAIPWFVLTTTGSASLTALAVFFNFLPARPRRVLRRRRRRPARIPHDERRRRSRERGCSRRDPDASRNGRHRAVAAHDAGLSRRAPRRAGRDGSSRAHPRPGRAGRISPRARERHPRSDPAELDPHRSADRWRAGGHGGCHECAVVELGELPRLRCAGRVLRAETPEAGDAGASRVTSSPSSQTGCGSSGASDSCAHSRSRFSSAISSRRRFRW